MGAPVANVIPASYNGRDEKILDVPPDTHALGKHRPFCPECRLQ